MSANPPLQARAGANSPLQPLAPEFSTILALNKKIQTAFAAPGVDVKIADGGKNFLSFTGYRAFVGANAGAAELTVTAFIKDPEGNTIQSSSVNLGPGPNDGSNFNLTQLLPEGYSLWVNATLTAGVYGGDLVFVGSMMEFPQLKSFGPQEVTTSLSEFIKASPGHALLVGLIQTAIYNTDSIDHDYEVYLVNDEGSSLVTAGTLTAGSVDNILAGIPVALNSGDSLKVKILVAIATAGRKVVLMGLVNESNELNL